MRNMGGLGFLLMYSIFLFAVEFYPMET